MEPSRYLELYPTGPNAELAQTFVLDDKPEDAPEDSVEEAGDGEDD
jgi:hypothetical protein